MTFYCFLSKRCGWSCLGNCWHNTPLANELFRIWQNFRKHSGTCRHSYVHCGWSQVGLNWRECPKEDGWNSKSVRLSAVLLLSVGDIEHHLLPQLVCLLSFLKSEETFIIISTNMCLIICMNGPYIAAFPCQLGYIAAVSRDVQLFPFKRRKQRP